MKTIVIRWKDLAATLIGVIIVLSVCGLSFFKVLRQRSRWTQSTQNMVTICGNGTGSCMISSNYENSTSQGWFNENTSPSNKPTTKAPGKRLRKGPNYRNRSNKKRKLDLPAIAEISGHTKHGSDKQIIPKNFSGFVRCASLPLPKAANMLEVTWKEMASVAKDVFQKTPNVSRTKAALKKRKGRNRRKKPITQRDAVLVLIPTQISKKYYWNKPNRPQPSEMEKINPLTNTDFKHDAKISHLLWAILGSNVLILLAVLLDRKRSCIKSLLGAIQGPHVSQDPERRRIAVNSDCNLAHLPLDLQEILKKKLDVYCERQGSYGWTKVGEAFQIPTDDLKFLELEYKREAGSPTLSLLEMLGVTKKKTISDLVTVLESPEVRRPDIFSVIILT